MKRHANKHLNNLLFEIHILFIKENYKWFFVCSLVRLKFKIIFYFNNTSKKKKKDITLKKLIKKNYR